jgi:hypothetical protein
MLCPDEKLQEKLCELRLMAMDHRLLLSLALSG